MLLTIYGAKVSKRGDKLVITLIEGEGDNKQYHHACVKLDNSAKTKVKVDEAKKCAVVKIPLLIKEEGF